MRMRMLSVGWMAMLASGAPIGELVASPPGTIQRPAFPAVPDARAAAPSGTVLAQSRIDAGPLQGPLNARKPSRPGARRLVPVHRVVRHRWLPRRAPPVLVTALPMVPFVPAYVYPPSAAYGSVVPVYAFRPLYRRYLYRPYFYQPYPYRPYFRRGFY